MKNLTIILVGAIAMAGIYFYKKYEEGIAAKSQIKPNVAQTIKQIPRKKNEDVFLDKTCSVAGYTCKTFDLDAEKEEGLMLKDKILYIVKNYKIQKQKTKELYNNLDITEKVRAQAYVYSVHPKTLGALSYGDNLLAVRIYIIHDDYGETKLLQGFELTKEIAMKIPVKMSRVIPEELFIGGNIKLADAYFKDKLVTIKRK